jgi:uncharacterized protein (DUF2252 family)
VNPPLRSRKKTPTERAAAGKQARQHRPRRALGEFTPASNRPDPVTTLANQETERVADLLPLRHERMSQTPFTFLRGAAAVMANDLASTPNTGITVQLCGDAHLSNLGLFAGPDRRLVFDLNDFDETNPGPFEWDVLRLASSFEVAARIAGHKSSFARTLPRIVAAAYRRSMMRFATMNDLDVWYYRIDTATLRQWTIKMGNRRDLDRLKQTERAAEAKNRWSAVRSLTKVSDGHRVFKSKPPLLVSLPPDDVSRLHVTDMVETYFETLLIDRADLLARYHWVDVGHKVVGVGSVGLLAFVLLLEGRDESDLLVLQIKQAVQSVLEPYTEQSTWSQHGERVVAGQRRMQATSDAFLGWVTGPGGRHFYVRQLRDMKWGPDPTTMTRRSFETYAELCGLTLARAHARSGDSVEISGYLGNSTAFDQSVQRFSATYADLTEADFNRYTNAIKDGRVSAGAGPE